MILNEDLGCPPKAGFELHGPDYLLVFVRIRS